MVIGLVLVLIIIGLIIGVFGIVLCSVHERIDDVYLITSRIAVHMAEIEHKANQKE